MVFEYMDHDLTGLSDRPGMRFSVPQIKVGLQSKEVAVPLYPFGFIDSVVVTVISDLLCAWRFSILMKDICCVHGGGIVLHETTFDWPPLLPC
jgi:hypothetical protein